MNQVQPNVPPEDSLPWVDTLRGIGPLRYIAKGATGIDVPGEFASLVSIDSHQAVLAVGARASRGLGIFMALLFLPGPLFFAWHTSQIIHIDHLKESTYFGIGIGIFLLGACILFASFDIRRIAENLVLLNRKKGYFLAADPTKNGKSPKELALLRWNWQDCDFAIERVIMSATGAQAFHLRAVQRNPHGEYERSVLLMAMIPTIQQAESIFEFLRRYMAHEDSALSNTIKLVPGGKLNFFEACKHSFITYLIDVGDDGLPRWPWPLIALFYGLLAAGLAVAFPFVIGKVIAEWSSQEMQFPPEQKSETAAPIPGITLIPAQQAIFAPWEKAYYLACMLTGAGLWTWSIWHYFLSSN